MKPEIKERLLNLINSGEYKMGKHNLYNPRSDTYCPLGILTELAIEAGVFEPVVRGPKGNKYLVGYGLSTLNEEVRNWAGLSIADCDRITNKNDSISTGAAVEYIKSL